MILCSGADGFSHFWRKTGARRALIDRIYSKVCPPAPIDAGGLISFGRLLVAERCGGAPAKERLVCLLLPRIKIKQLCIAKHMTTFYPDLIIMTYTEELRAYVGHISFGLVH